MSDSVAVRGTLGNYGLDSLYRLDRFLGAGRVGEVFHGWALHADLRQAYDRTFMPGLVEEMVQDDLAAQKTRDGYLRQHIRRYGKKLLPEELSLVLRTKFALDPRLGAWQDAGTLTRSVATVAQADGQVQEQVRVPVVIKLLRVNDGEGKSESIKRALKEWRSQAKIVHPNLVGVLDAGMGRLRLDGATEHPWHASNDDKCAYLVLENVPGALAPAQAAKLSGVEQVAAIRQAAAGLKALHAQGVLHRDIHPGNLLISRTGGVFVAKLAEYGVLQTGIGAETPGLSGTVGPGAAGAYRSPEEAIDARGLTPAADLYSLAATLHFYSFGRAPFAECGGDAKRILQRKLAGQMPEFPGGQHDFLIAMLKRGMAADPQYRYGSLKEFLRDLGLYVKILQREPVELQGASDTIEVDRTLLGVPRPLPDAVRPNAWKSPGAPRDPEFSTEAPAPRVPSGSLDTEFPGPLAAPLPARMVSGRMEVMRLAPEPDLPEVGGSLPRGGMRRGSVGARRVTAGNRRVTGGHAAARTPESGAGGARVGNSANASGRAAAATATIPNGGAVVEPATSAQRPFTSFQWIGLVVLVSCIALTGFILFLRSMEPASASKQEVRGLNSPATDPLQTPPGAPISAGGEPATAHGATPPRAAPTGKKLRALADSLAGSAGAVDLDSPKDDIQAAASAVTGNGGKTGAAVQAGAPDGSAKVGTTSAGTPATATTTVDYAKFVAMPVNGKLSKRLNAAVFSPDGRKLLTASDDPRLVEWTSAEGDFVYELRGHSGAVSAAVFDPRHGAWVLSGGADGKALVFDLEGEHAEATTVLSPGCAVTCVAVSHDGRRAFIGDAKGTGHFFSTNDWKERATRLALGGAIGRACFTKDGSQLITAEQDPANPALSVWDVATGERIKQLGEHKGWIASLDISPDGATLLAADWQSNSLIEFNTADWSMKRRLTDPGAQPLAAVYTADGHAIVSGGRDTNVKVWDAATGTLLIKLVGLEQNNYCRSVDVTADGRCLVAAYEDGSFRLFRDPAAPLPGSGLYVEPKETAAPGAVNLCERKKLVHLSTAELDGKPVMVPAERLATLVDGNLAGDAVELPTGTAVIVDLGEICAISALRVYHEPRYQHRYLDQVWQLSLDEKFDEQVLSVFNTDGFDTHGLGRGKDADYIADAEGKQVSFAPVQARFIRVVCGGNNVDTITHLLEIQVYGTPVSAAAPAPGPAGPLVPAMPSASPSRK